MIMDVASPSDVPRIAEPFFLTYNAEMRFHVCMTPDDLAKAGLEDLGDKLGYGRPPCPIQSPVSTQPSKGATPPSASWADALRSRQSSSGNPSFGVPVGAPTCPAPPFRV